MKKVLIISPYFVPVNAADMQRVRTSLPYFIQNGWESAVVMVDEQYTDINRDELLQESIPHGINIYRVKALNKKITSKLGLGSIALRSLPYYRKEVDKLLSKEHFDLVYFSTTQFPVCILGRYWKKRFGIPYVIDMQDPWHSDYYQDKPKNQRPPKYWFSYRLNKYLEPMAIKHADGLISVSESYIETLKARYPSIKNIPSATITFGAFEPDLQVAEVHSGEFKDIFDHKFINIVYAGRGGADMHKAITPCFEVLKTGLSENAGLFSRIRFYFIGTSYAPQGQGMPTILPLAKQYGVDGQVFEQTDRLSYYNTLAILKQADALFIPGSDDPQYTASKLYPYLLLQKPLLALFHEASSAMQIVNDCTQNANLFSFSSDTNEGVNGICDVLKTWLAGNLKPATLTPAFGEYGAEHLTAKQTELFNRVLTLAIK